jgi:hypothetical protein
MRAYKVGHTGARQVAVNRTGAEGVALHDLLLPTSVVGRVVHCDLKLAGVGCSFASRGPAPSTIE